MKIQQFLQRKPKTENRKPSFLLLALLLPLLTCCLEREFETGYVTATADFSAIQPGVSTAEDVLKNLGSPSSRAAFGDPTWYYISGKAKSVAFLRPETVDQQVVAIVFTREGVVKEIKQHGLAERQEVTFEQATTPTEGNSMNIVQQLLGNLGRFGGGQRSGIDRGRQGGGGPSGSLP